MEWVIATAQRFLANGAGRDKGSHATLPKSRAFRRASPKGENNLREENVPQWLTAPISVAQQAPKGNSRAPPERSHYALIDLTEVKSLTSIGRSAIYAAIAIGAFPAPVKFGTSSRWVFGEVISWTKNRIAERDREAEIDQRER